MIDSLYYSQAIALFYLFSEQLIDYNRLLSYKQMSNQFFQSDPKDIGLFTFYRSQQEQEQKYQNLREKLKQQLNKNEQIREREKQQMKRSIFNQRSQEKLTKLLSKNNSKKEMKQNKSNRTQETLSRYRINTEEKVNMLQKRVHQERQSKDTKMMKKNSLKRSLNKRKVIQSKQLQLPKKQIHKITLYQQRMLHTPQLSKSTLRQRTHTHFDNHFRKKQDKSKEQEAIKIRLFPQEFKKESRDKMSIRTVKEKLLFLDSGKTQRLLTQQEKELMASNTHKQLHEQNKKYINSLIENGYLHPEYNQTAYRILRDTLKLPQVNNNPRYIKTEQNSPSFSPKRSSSFFKKINSKNQIFKQSLRQFTQKHNTKVMVKGSLITQQTFGK